MLKVNKDFKDVCIIYFELFEFVKFIVDEYIYYYDNMLGVYGRLVNYFLKDEKVVLECFFDFFFRELEG